MVVATLLVHGGNGFFMNWYGNQKGEGFECHVLTLGLALVVILAGAGKWSIDAALSGWLETAQTPNSKITTATTGRANLVADTERAGSHAVSGPWLAEQTNRERIGRQRGYDQNASWTSHAQDES
jgi:hypothetical protein